VTATGPQHRPPQAQPGAGNQRPDTATADPQHCGGKPPQFVIEVWASPQLRNQVPSRAPSLAEALARPATPRDPEPDREPELEP
jgi:hypothetical protein